MIEPIEPTVEGWSRDLPDTYYVRQQIAEGIARDIMAAHLLNKKDELVRAAMLGMTWHDLKEKYV